MDTPALDQCLQRFRAPKVGIVNKSLKSSEHDKGLLAAPRTENKKNSDGLKTTKGKRSGYSISHLTAQKHNPLILAAPFPISQTTLLPVLGFYTVPITKVHKHPRSPLS